MEIDTNGDIEQRERSIGTGRCEGQLAILVAIPQNTAFRELYRLLAFYCLTLGCIGRIQCKLNLLAADNAYLDTRLFLQTLNIEH